MGVRGLTTFIEDNHRAFYNRGNVHDCHLVIDGYGLLYHLYFGSGDGLDAKCGGEFAAFAEVIERFFSNLKACSIIPYVVFDGPINSEKLPCILTRLQQRVRDVQNVLRNECNSMIRMMPLFAVDVLYHHLSTHGIPYAMSLVDADNEIVAVANYLKCPVLSEDSDYYIYNVENGYVPLQHFYWEKINVDSRSKRKSLVCHKYHISRMYDAYRVPVQFLPFVSILLGNDWIDRETFAHLISTLPRPQQHLKRKKAKKNHEKFETVFSWLSSKSGSESSVLNKLKNSVPPNSREAIMCRVDACLAMYRDQLDVSRTLQVLGLTGPKHPRIFEDPREEVEDLVRRNCVHPIAVNILYSNYICLPVIMSDPGKPSPHFCASGIRTLLYRVLLRKYHFKIVGPEFLFLQEYDKVEMAYKKSKNVSVFTSLCPMCEQHHLLEDSCSSTSQVTKPGFLTLELILKENSDISFSKFAKKNDFPTFQDQNFMKYLDIVMASTMLWFNKTSPDPEIFWALILSIAWSMNHKISCSEILTQPIKCSDPLNDPISSQKSDCDITENGLLESISPSTVETASGERETIESSEFSTELLHSASEWLCILNAVVLLHQVVELPTTKFAMQDFLRSSVFFHDVHSRIARLSKSKDCKNDLAAFGDEISDCLKLLPKLAALFGVLGKYLLQEELRQRK